MVDDREHKNSPDKMHSRTLKSPTAVHTKRDRKCMVGLFWNQNYKLTLRDILAPSMSTSFRRVRIDPRCFCTAPGVSCVTPARKKKAERTILNRIFYNENQNTMPLQTKRAAKRKGTWPAFWQRKRLI